MNKAFDNPGWGGPLFFFGFVVLILVVACAAAHAEVRRLGDCAVFPPAPVRVVHRPHHFAHHRAPVCHCNDELGGPAGGGAPSDGFSFNNGGNDNGMGFYQGDAGGDSAGGGDSAALAAMDDLNFVGGPVFYHVGLGVVVGGGNAPPGGMGGSPTLVPEPSTLALVALGAGALLLKWRVS